MGRCSRARQQLDENCCLAIQTNASQTQSSVTQPFRFFFLPGEYCNVSVFLNRGLPLNAAIHGCNPLLSHVAGSSPDAAKLLKIQSRVLKIAVSPRKLASYWPGRGLPRMRLRAHCERQTSRTGGLAQEGVARQRGAEADSAHNQWLSGTMRFAKCSHRLEQKWHIVARGIYRIRAVSGFG